ncbi:hypothetical protein SPAN111604_05005 [Sphingomonas antarctica]|uniref:hypothetical protein n=1 Tax=Sphingomonas antarctica TaxID=2040274 RepID=UPI0039E89FCC
MWPFTGKRIFANRWWALAFAAFVCWQAADMADSASSATNSAASVGGALGNSN